MEQTEHQIFLENLLDNNNKNIIESETDCNQNEINSETNCNQNEIDSETNNEFILDGQLITYIDIPKEDNWKIEPLYMDMINGKTMYWQIGFNNEQLMIIFGYIDGKKQKDIRKINRNQSGRTLQQQALLEARSRYLEKYDQGYRPGSEELSMEIKDSKPMLANEYWKGGYNDKKNRNMKSNIDKWPIAVMAKLDGERTLIRKEGNDIKMRSRSGKNQILSNSHFLHIREDIINFFKYLPEKSILDGELYNHDMIYNQIQSAISTHKNGIHNRHKDIKLFIFDIIEPKRLSFIDRYTLIVNAYNRYLEDGNKISEFSIVPIILAYNHDDIDNFHNQYVELGYEGLILRPLDSIYRPTRCNNLLKYKHFYDEEGIIIRIEDGNGSDENCAIFVIQDKRGNELRIRPRGTYKERKYWYYHPSEIIGKLYTFRYFELSLDNIPRFPTGKGFR